jgi:hypothetical protein
MKKALVLVVLVLASCSSDELRPSLGVLAMYGGPAQFSENERACLRQNPDLLAIVRNHRSDDSYSKNIFRKMTIAEYECFSNRLIAALAADRPAFKACNQDLLRTKLRLGAESGKNLITVAQDQAIASVFLPCSGGSG